VTIDELIDLCEGLLDEAGFNLTVLRSGVGILEGLSDEQFLLATRFVAGERPPQAQIEELDEETPTGPVDIGDGVILGL
jgi:hypothetical protein